MTARIVVTGTGTDIGKTVFAAGLTMLLDGVYWKPVQAGTADATDAETVRTLGVAADRILPEAYRLATPCSPHEAAAREGVMIDPARLVLPGGDRPLVIEGAGGALVPFNTDMLFADLVAQWKVPAVIVASTQLGTINHSLLTIEALRARDIPMLGIAFIGAPVEASEAAIASFGRVRRLGRLPRLAPLNRETLAVAFRVAFRAEDFA